MTESRPAAPTIFYSWQSDLPNPTNRGLIESALELALAEIASDATIDVCPRLDDAGTDVTGAHDIAATILRKIETATLFVADVSLVGNATPTRSTPNPNVLVEVGYALKALGPDRVLLVFNQAYGRIEDLPFDLRPRKTMSYRAEPGDTAEAQTARRGARKQLGNAVASVIRAVITKDAAHKIVTAPTRLQRAIDGATNSTADVKARIVEYMTEVARAIEDRLPTKREDDRSDDVLVKNIEECGGLVRDFAELAEVIARHGTSLAATAAMRGLEGVLQLYELSPPRQGPAFDSDFDLSKFLGHELFVVLIAALLKHEAFACIKDVLDTDLCIEKHSGRTTVSWGALSKHLRTLRTRQDRLKLRGLSLHADMLKTRHETAPVSELSPFAAFMDADYFLYLASALHPAAKPFEVGAGTWRGWSLAYLSWAEPTFLARAQSRRYAEQLLGPFRLASTDELRSRFRERGLLYGTLFGSWGLTVEGGMDSERIASTP